MLAPSACAGVRGTRVLSHRRHRRVQIIITGAHGDILQSGATLLCTHAGCDFPSSLLIFIDPLALKFDANEQFMGVFITHLATKQPFVCPILILPLFLSVLYSTSIFDTI